VVYKQLKGKVPGAQCIACKDVIEFYLD